MIGYNLGLGGALSPNPNTVDKLLISHQQRHRVKEERTRVDT
jgi:hypothetical protein